MGCTSLLSTTYLCNEGSRVQCCFLLVSGSKESKLISMLLVFSELGLIFGRFLAVIFFSSVWLNYLPFWLEADRKLSLRHNPSKHLKVGHHRPASETPFERRFAGVPMVAEHCMYALKKYSKNFHLIQIE